MGRELAIVGDPKLEMPKDPHIGTVRVSVVKLAREDENASRALLNTIVGKSEDEFLEPLYSPDKLVALYEKSALLRPNIDAMATNIDAFGHMFEPAIKLDAPDVRERVRTALLVDALIGTTQQPGPRDNTRSLAAELAELSAAAEPADAAVDETIKLLRRLAVVELCQLKSFFAYVCAESSFPELRCKMRTDLESGGNAYWEVTRDRTQALARFAHIPLTTIRMTAQGKEPVRVEERVRVTDLSWRTIVQTRRFRRYAQFVDGAGSAVGVKRTPSAWFKEFGDPRTLSRQTGKFYADAAALERAEGAQAEAASEILHFSIYTPATPYGTPRYMGNTPGVLGSRWVDEINEAYFDNKAIPPLLLMVAGGRLGKGVTDRLGDIFQSNKGIKNFHNIGIVEAEPAPSSTGQVPTSPNMIPKIAIERLRDAQQDDGLFQTYDTRNAAKLDASFRIPPALKGGKPELSALRQTETQVFAPHRAAFDELMNRRVLPELGIRFWRFKSNGPALYDHEAMGRLLVDLTNAAAIRPSEARELASILLQRELPAIDEEWAKRPLPLSVAMLRAMAGPAEAVRVQEGEIPSADAVHGALGITPPTQSLPAPREPEPEPPAPVKRAPRRRNPRSDE